MSTAHTEIGALRVNGEPATPQRTVRDGDTVEVFPPAPEIGPEAQLREVAARYALAARARPFTLCLICNRALEPVARSAVAHRLPAKVLQEQEIFSRCPGCERVYWPGSHYRRMRQALEQVPGFAGER